jgi:chromosome segregation ATPase
MNRELEPLMAGNRKDKEVEKSTSFWYENAFPVAYSCRFLQVEEPPKGTMQEQAKISASQKTDAKALTTEPSSIDSQLSVVFSQLNTVNLQSLASSHQMRDLLTQISAQNAQFADMKTQLSMHNYLDVLPHQLRTRNTQLDELLKEKCNLTSRVSEFNDIVADKIENQDTDFSDLMNDIAEWNTASTALNTKATAFQNDIKKPLRAESGEASLVRDTLQPVIYGPAFKSEE